MKQSHELVQAIESGKALLFVGAGVSMNLGLPSFTGLIDRMAEEMGYEPAQYRELGDYRTLAEFYRQERGTLKPLRDWMERSWHTDEIRIEQSRIHRAIVDLEFPVIYTTNYDHWLERAFDAFGKPYTRITGVADIPRHVRGNTEIVKFHGDLDVLESIILTESSYFDRMAFESPLDIKLRSDVLGRTVLFIGYSLSDVNVRYMLYRLQKQWERDGALSDRPTSYIFLAHPNAAQERVLKSRGIEPVVSHADHPADGLLDFLSDLVARAGKRAAN
jgi:NAD-dependent SIR2 family protein deacetylase